ncbi:hypothetical protein [Bacillus canaveralius]|nr:hypothetical protein [Bacillus canaveralius]
MRSFFYGDFSFYYFHEETAVAAQSLAQLAEELNQSVSGFKVN